MRLDVSEARSQLGRLCARAQDPRQPIILTRHGNALAAIVSMAEAERIWQLQEDQWFGRKSLLTGRWRGKALVLPKGLVPGPDGQLMTERAAAHQIHDVQMTRAEERRILADGGLLPLPDGEVAERRSSPW